MCVCVGFVGNVPGSKHEAWSDTAAPRMLFKEDSLIEAGGCILPVFQMEISAQSLEEKNKTDSVSEPKGRRKPPERATRTGGFVVGSVCESEGG